MTSQEELVTKMNNMIYVKFKHSSPRELIEKLFKTPIGNFSFACDELTYEDVECTVVQCNRNKIRSFDDIWELVNTYYNVELKDFMHILVTTEIPGRKFFFSSCGTIERITLGYINNDYGIYDYNFFIAKYDSPYTWLYLLGLLGITDAIGLRKYIAENK